MSITAACLHIEAFAGQLLATEDRNQLVDMSLWRALYQTQALASAASPHHAAAANALCDVMRAIVAATADAYIALPFVASGAATIASQWDAPGAAQAMQAVAYELATLLPVPARAASATKPPAPSPGSIGRLMFRVTELVIPTPEDCALAP